MKKRSVNLIPNVNKALVLVLSKIFLLAILVNAAQAEDRSPYTGEQLHFFRWLEDYRDFPDTGFNKDPLAAIKHIELSDRYPTYLTLGGDYRLRYESYSNQKLGLKSYSPSHSALHRFMLHADLQFEQARVFMQLANYKEQGLDNNADPFAESETDLQQAFIDWKFHELNVRLGRQELILGGGKKTGIREGKNQRRALDGVKLSHKLGTNTIAELLYMQEVRPNDVAFQDSSSDGAKLYGAYFNSVMKWTQGNKLDLFYLGFERNNAIFEQGIADEKRQSIGARLWNKTGNFNFDYELTYQFGDFGSDTISALGFATDSSYSLGHAFNWSPKVGLRFDYASGDKDQNDNSLGTYNALFPNAAYVSEAAIFAPANMWDIQPYLEIYPYEGITLFTGVSYLWRDSLDDGVYLYPGSPAISSQETDNKSYGYQINLVAKWNPSNFITLQAAYVNTLAGDVITDVGGEDSEFFMFSLGMRF